MSFPGACAPASVGLVAPRIRKDLAIPEALQQTALRTFTRALAALEGHWLANTAFLASPTPTIADIAACVDIGQLQLGYTGLFDFGPYPRVRAWLDAMRAVDGYDEVHLPLTVLGDARGEPPTMDAIREANLRGLAAVRARLARQAS